MYTSVDKALVGVAMGILFVMTSLGVTVPDWANQTAITAVLGVLTPVLVYFIPNKGS
ncbi:unnamed protein product [marine sediment metagenome]|uniref:Uncharacterized protein n=1 Tax=marine sediment metagenome TaxID=412755 RepID=X0UKW7_9ZZZZ